MKTNKNMTNQELVQLFEALAAALKIKKADLFRTLAYERAAASIIHSEVEIKELWQQGKLTTLPAIGAGIAQHLDELFRTGKVKHFKEIFSGLPEAMFVLLAIPGIGPKTAYKLCQLLGIRKSHNAVKKLAKAAQDQEIRRLEGFGKESEQDILRGIKELNRLNTGRMLLPKALIISQELVDYLQKDKNTLKVESLGSLRRRCATIGDLDLGVASKNPAKTIAWLVKYKKIKQVLAQGSKKASVILFSGHQVDVRAQSPASFGALLQYFTGSKLHNINLRLLAKEKGLSLSEYGIKMVQDLEGKVQRFSNEQRFYNFLGLEWIPPVLRENQGEIQAAAKQQLPQLVNLGDIKGDLHLHSDFNTETSHDLGQSSFKAIIEQAISLNYQYIAFSDHSPSVSRHSSQEVVEMIKKRKDYFEQKISSNEKLLKKRKLKVLVSLEIDILSDGKLAIPEKAFAWLDFAIVSVHSSFRLSRTAMTKRVIKALTSHPKIKILGHPTGRILNQRQGYQLDWPEIFDCCLKEKKFLEINAFPDRLDLPEGLIKQAISRGVGLSINTDSHDVKNLSNMIYGVYTAQRGWAEPKDIINTLPWEQLKPILGIK